MVSWGGLLRPLDESRVQEVRESKFRIKVKSVKITCCKIFRMVLEIGEITV